MEAVREVTPFLVGLALPPFVMLIIHKNWSGRSKFAVVFVTVLVLGLLTSFFAGELLGGMPDGLIAIMIDTSLVFTGSQVAYRLFWKAALEARLQPDDGVPAPERAPRR